jgi:hypothetical protein
MKTIVQLFVAVLAIAMLADCATTGMNSQHGAVVVPMNGSGTPITKEDLAAFPSSPHAAKGKPWTHMRKNGFTGSIQDACGLMGLTDVECSTYKYKHENGLCEYMDVPNGVVLDALTYTRGNKNYAQKDVLVKLKNLSTRKTEVCDLGGGVYAMRFLGCGNHGLVRGFFPAPETAAVQPEQSVAQECIPMEGSHDWNVVFPNVKDFSAWRMCNPHAECSRECEHWIRYGGQGYDSADVPHVRAVTGQEREHAYALKNVRYRPSTMFGRAVLCQQNTRRYWHMERDGSVHYGIGDQ